MKFKENTIIPNFQNNLSTNNETFNSNRIETNLTTKKGNKMNLKINSVSKLLLILSLVMSLHLKAEDIVSN